MANQKELDSTYMGVAILHAKLSKARRTRVGACLVTNQGVCIPGYNGTPSGLCNNCEDLAPAGQIKQEPYGWLVTKPEVIHAELNCILKAAKEGISCKNATAYVTLSPCVPCAAMLINAGIARLVYQDIYRDTQGLDLLKKAGIVTEKYEGETNV